MISKMQKLAGAATLLSVAALVLCIIMSVHSLSGEALPGCGPGSACDSVLAGKWSKVFGIFPVSGLAAGIYLALLACLVCLLFIKDEDIVSQSSSFIPVIAGAISGSAVWFISLQIFAEKAFCKYCMSAHSIGLVVSALLLIALWRRVKRCGLLFCCGIFLAGLLAVAQVLTAPDYIYQDGEAGEPFPMIAADDAPVIGNPDAEYVIDLLFDYQCSHCQKLHGILPDVVERFGGKVAFVLCPCPLSSKCNPYIPREDNSFEGSCDLAKLSLALFSLDRDAFVTFDSWLFQSDPEKGWWPRPVAEAKAYAESLVGPERLSAALSDGFVSGRIARTADLFGRTTVAGKGGIPRFIFSNRWLVPEVDTPEEIVEILSSEFEIIY